MMKRISLSYEEIKDYIDKLIQQLNEEYGMSISEIEDYTGEIADKNNLLLEIHNKMLLFAEEYKFLFESYKKEEKLKEEVQEKFYNNQALLEGKLVEIEDMFNSMRMTELVIGDFELALSEKDRKIASLNLKIEKIESEFQLLKKDYETILEEKRLQIDNGSDDSFLTFRPRCPENPSCKITLAEEIFHVAEKSINSRIEFDYSMLKGDCSKMSIEKSIVEFEEPKIIRKPNPFKCYSIRENLGIIFRESCLSLKSNFREYIFHIIFLILMVTSHLDPSNPRKLSETQINKINHPDNFHNFFFIRYRNPSDTLT